MDLCISETCKYTWGSQSFGTLLRSHSPTINEHAKQLEIDSSASHYKDIKVPTYFDGRKTWKGLLSPILDQFNCASCYSFASVGVLADLYAIHTVGNVKPKFNPLEPIMCMGSDDTWKEFQEIFTDIADVRQEKEAKHLLTECAGNTIYSVGRYLYRAGAVEDSCIPFKYLSNILYNTGRIPICTAIEGIEGSLCLNNEYAKRRWTVFTFYTLKPIENNTLEHTLMVNVMKWGPIVVAFNVYKDFLETYDGKSVYIPEPLQKSLGGHAVKLIGWGEENGTPYWLCANSWGTKWGDDGYFKIVRGNKMLELEHNNMALWPDIPNIKPSHLKEYQDSFLDEMSLVSELDVKERNFYDVDPQTFYPKKQIKLIKAGKLKGELTPIFKPDKTPIDSKFSAYLVGLAKFPTMGNTLAGYNYPVNFSYIGVIVGILLLCILFIRLH